MGRTLPDGSPTRGFDPRRGYSMVTLDVEGVTGLPVTPPKFLERPTGFEPATSSLGSIFDATACVTRPENWRDQTISATRDDTRCPQRSQEMVTQMVTRRTRRGGSPGYGSISSTRLMMSRISRIPFSLSRESYRSSSRAARPALLRLSSERARHSFSERLAGRQR